MTFRSLPEQSGGKAQKLAELRDENYSSLTFQGPRPTGF